MGAKVFSWPTQMNIKVTEAATIKANTGTRLGPLCNAMQRNIKSICTHHSIQLTKRYVSTYSVAQNTDEGDHFLTGDGLQYTRCAVKCT